MSVATLEREIILNPEKREFPEFSLERLLGTVFEPTQGAKVCILIDLEDMSLMKGYGFLNADGHEIQKKAYEEFYLGLKDGGMEALGMTGGDLFAFPMTYGSNLDLKDECYDVEGNELSLDKDIYTNYDLILCVSTYSATAPLTAKCKEFGFRGATLHGVNDVILNSGLAVNYHEVSADAEKMRAAMSNADTIEIDFTLEDGRILTASLDLNGQDAQKSHGLCQGTTPDVANLPAGEV